MSDDDTTRAAVAEAGGEERPSIGARIVAEVKSRPVAWITFAALLVIAPVILKMIFPEATPGVLVAGTIAFTAYAAACTVPGRFL
jgi:hypothetical protein